MRDPSDPPACAASGHGRARADRCPGALQLHAAQDGALARVRVPGGILPARALVALADAAAELGDARLELTSRANIQIRGMAADAGPRLAERLRAVGLFPSPAHERVRNIVASPLTGVDSAGLADLTGPVRALDRALCARPRLAALPGRFLFALDDGRGDLSGFEADVQVSALCPDEVRVGPAEVVVGTGDAVAAAIAVAEAFLDEQRAQSATPEHAAWHVRELAGGAGRVGRRARARLDALGVRSRQADPPAPPRDGPHPVGVGVQRDGRHSLTVLAPLGRLDGGQARTLARLAGPRGIRTTPWRSVVVTDLADPVAAVEAAAAVGLGVDPDSPWFNVTSCAGRPGCASALADVQADARAVAAADSGSHNRLAVHWSGCERRCGRPSWTVVDVLAAGNGYRVCDAYGRIHRVADSTGLAETVEVLRRG